MFSIGDAQLPALLVESMFYGIHLITFFTCLRRLLYDSKYDRKPMRYINIPMISIVSLLFVSSTLYLVTGFVGSMEYFIYTRGRSGAIQIDELGHSWLNFMKTMTITIHTIAADIVLVYRCWIIWNKLYLVALVPLVCWLGTIACGICVLYYQLKLQCNPSLPFYKQIFGVSVGFWGSTTVLNAFSTSMILWKIWSVQQAWKPPSICSVENLPQRNRLNFATRNIVESGLIYTLMTFLVFIAHFLASSAVLIVGAAEIQVTGIAFDLILMRAAGPYPDRLHTIPRSCTVSDEQMEYRRTVDVAVMAVEDHDLFV